jgi:hypothetical protein
MQYHFFFVDLLPGNSQAEIGICGAVLKWKFHLLKPEIIQAAVK